MIGIKLQPLPEDPNIQHLNLTHPPSKMKFYSRTDVEIFNMMFMYVYVLYPILHQKKHSSFNGLQVVDLYEY